MARDSTRVPEDAEIWLVPPDGVLRMVDFQHDFYEWVMVLENLIPDDKKGKVAEARRRRFDRRILGLLDELEEATGHEERMIMLDLQTLSRARKDLNKYVDFDQLYG